MRLQEALQLLLVPRQCSHRKGLLLLLGARLPLGPHLHPHGHPNGLLLLLGARLPLGRHLHPHGHPKGLLLLLGAWRPLGPHPHGHPKGLLPLGAAAEAATECAIGTGLCA